LANSNYENLELKYDSLQGRNKHSEEENMCREKELTLKIH
jgi:hypothetical protein